MHVYPVLLCECEYMSVYESSIMFIEMKFRKMYKKVVCVQCRFRKHPLHENHINWIEK